MTRLFLFLLKEMEKTVSPEPLRKFPALQVLLVRQDTTELPVKTDYQALRATTAKKEQLGQ